MDEANVNYISGGLINNFEEHKRIDSLNCEVVRRSFVEYIKTSTALVGNENLLFKKFIKSR